MADYSHDELRRIFDLVLNATLKERPSVLEKECKGDQELRQRIEAMVTAADGTNFLGNPTAQSDVAEDTADLINPISISAEVPPDERMIDRYKLLQQIGEGGFGTVWMAEQKDPVVRRVALKIIKLGMDSKHVIARFEVERQALALMDHPNIAKVFDAGTTRSGRPYFVMEYIKGIPILEYCDTERLDTKKRLELFTRVCLAIQHAHQKGIIHRDIKPSNVLITLHDGVPVPKVIDFGIAKATNAELTQKTLFTEHRQLIGTPAYMSPEQAEMSSLDIDTRSDVYSLGVLLYELLTGTTPFDSKSLLDAGFAGMMKIIRDEEPSKPSTRLSTLGEQATHVAKKRRSEVGKLSLLLRHDLDWIVMKCLEKDRTRRYESASGLAEDIYRHMTDEPVSAGPPSTRYRFQKFVRRNRVQVFAGSVVVAAVLFGAAGTTYGMLRALNEQARVQNQTRTASTALRDATDELLVTLDEISQITGEPIQHEHQIINPADYTGMEVDGLGVAAKGLASILARNLKDEANSRVAAEKRLKEHLASASQLSQDAADSTIADEVTWAESRAAANYLRDLVESGQVGTQLEADVQQFLIDYARVERARSFAETIESILIERATHMDPTSWRTMERRIVKSLRVYGVDLDQQSPKEVINAVNEAGENTVLADAIELWLGTIGQLATFESPVMAKQEFDEWITVLYEIDPDPVRTGVRRLLYAGQRIDASEVDALCELPGFEYASPRTIGWIGSLYAIAGSPEQATQLVLNALLEHPNDFMLNFDHALGLEYRQDYGGAISYYLRCTALRPDSAGVWRSLGSVYLKSGDTDQAIDTLSKSIELTHDHAPTHADLARAHRAAGDIIEAIVSQEKAISLLGQDHPEIESYQELLEFYKTQLDN